MTERRRFRLAVLASHPIQYYGPLFRELAKSVDLYVFFAHRATAQQQAAAGFGTAFEWDVDLTSGYEHSFLTNVSKAPGVDHFGGCDTPEIGKRLTDGKFDALLVSGWFLKTFLQGIWAAKRLGLPVLIRGDSQLETPRPGPKRWLKELAYPPFLRSFDAALYVGQRSRAYYEHYRYPKARLFSSPHCVDTGWFASRAGPKARAELRGRLGIGEAEKVALFAGKLVPFKRPLDAVEICAAASAQGAPVRLLVAGSGELEAALSDRARALKAPCDLLGFQNQSLMPAAYSAADALILPSDGHETWGLVCNEALACGAPLLVSDAAGCVDDLTGEGLGGLSYRMGDITDAAEKLVRLLRKPPAQADLVALSDRHGLAAAAAGVVRALRWLHDRSALSPRDQSA